MSLFLRLSRPFRPKMLLIGAAMVAFTAGMLFVVSLQFQQLEAELGALPDRIIPFDAAAADMVNRLAGTHRDVLDYLQRNEPGPHPGLEDALSLSRFDTQFARQQPTEQQRRLGRELGGIQTEFIARGEALMARHDAWRLQLARLDHAVTRLQKFQINPGQIHRLSLPATQSHSVAIRQQLDTYRHTRAPESLLKITQEAEALSGLLPSSGPGSPLAKDLHARASEIVAVVKEMLRLQQAQTFALSRFNETTTQFERLLQQSRQQLASWKLTAPQHALQTSAHHVFMLIVTLGLALLAFWLWAVWHLARTVAEPLNKLKQGVAMLAEGNLTHRVDYRRSDTFGELIRDFNLMSDQLQQHLSKLQLNNLHQAQQIEAGTLELIAQSSHDALTGLANRGSLLKFVEEAIAAVRGGSGQFALLQIDLDGFKNINVSEGHDQGDRLLRVVGRRLQGQIQEEDLAARVGGDEFCLVLMAADLERTTEFARRCLQALNAPIYLDGISTRPRASIGITFYPGDGDTPHELMKAADMAMYAAKNAGKHRYALYEAGMTQKVTRQFALETALREAVERGEFELHYQPQIELGSGRLSGVEALIRWPRTGHGLVPPDEFIPVAERVGLVDAIGVWVLETACRQAVMWHREGLTSLVMAVNISPRHFESPDFIDTVARVLLVTGIAPACLEIEVTESVTRDSLRHASISESLRRLGVRVAIDDFGTGYSSLAVLKKMPIDTLKLDRAFIRDMLEDSGSSMLIGTLIGMAKGLHLTTVAEGVETLEQVRVLTALGCPLAQGYYFSRPVKADQVPALARTDFLLRASAPQMVAASTATGTHGK